MNSTRIVYNQQNVNTSNKYSITNDIKTLIITNITKEDVGECSDKFDGFGLYHYNGDGEEKVLQLLRHYPVLSPVVFSVFVEGKYTTMVLSSRIDQTLKTLVLSKYFEVV